MAQGVTFQIAGNMFGTAAKALQVFQSDSSGKGGVPERIYIFQIFQNFTMPPPAEADKSATHQQQIH